jgi:hypothetical protein
LQKELFFKVLMSFERKKEYKSTISRCMAAIILQNPSIFDGFHISMQ